MSETKPTTTASPNENKVETPKVITVGIVTPNDELYNAIKKAAGDKPVSAWAREILAEKVGVKLDPTATTRKKYNSEEEKVAAQEKARKDHAALVRYLLAKHKALAAGKSEAEAEQLAIQARETEPKKKETKAEEKSADTTTTEEKPTEEK